jgi:hypothetical protein
MGLSAAGEISNPGTARHQTIWACRRQARAFWSPEIVPESFGLTPKSVFSFFFPSSIDQTQGPKCGG